MLGAYTHEPTTKTPEANQPPPGTEAPKFKKRCQNNLHNYPPTEEHTRSIPTVTVFLQTPTPT